MSTTRQERIDTIVRNIMSGHNRCGTLASAVNNGDSEYFQDCIAPVVDAYEGEAAFLRELRDTAQREANDLRRALEFVAQNLGGAVKITEPAIVQAISAALGRPL